MSIRKARADRRGFGTTATLVLVILGIAMFILVVQDLMRQGSSISIGRAYATAHVLRVGRMALDEAFTSKKGKETLNKTLVKGLVQAASQLPGAAALTDGTPAERDRLVQTFLSVIYHPPGPARNKIDDLFQNLPDEKRRVELLLGPGTADVPVKGAYWVRGTQPPGNGNVEFDSDPAFTSPYRAETVDLAYKHEVDSGVLKVEDVQMRVMAFRHDKARNPPQGTGPGLAWGKGLVRAQVKLRWVLPREVEGRAIAINRTMLEDRLFTLVAPQDPPIGQQQQEDWKVEIYETEWQRGTSDL